mmetsp:Transcript_5868/g.13909  ORF Transcript_5868/g.13909 Transcript_5868/m.13909 type:complete len:259 (+) Transcript_5868:131-907(+)
MCKAVRAKMERGCGRGVGRGWRRECGKGRGEHITAGRQRGHHPKLCSFLLSACCRAVTATHPIRRASAGVSTRGGRASPVPHSHRLQAGRRQNRLRPPHLSPPPQPCQCGEEGGGKASASRLRSEGEWERTRAGPPLPFPLPFLCPPAQQRTQRSRLPYPHSRLSPPRPHPALSSHLHLPHPTQTWQISHCPRLQSRPPPSPSPPLPPQVFERGGGYQPGRMPAASFCPPPSLPCPHFLAEWRRARQRRAGRKHQTGR